MQHLNKTITQIYTGNGKGKTTAALGLAARAAGNQLKVKIIQFMKHSPYAGELTAMKKLGIEIKQYGTPCPDKHEEPCPECFKPKPQDKENAQKALQDAAKSAASGEYDLLILDEANNAAHKKLINTQDLLNIIKNKHKNTELVITGRNAAPELIEAADLITTMQDTRHPYNTGLQARKGIEY